MKNLVKYLQEIYEKVYTITDKGRIKQREQLELKNNLTQALLDDLAANDVEAYLVPKGIAIIIPNEEEGFIPLEINIVTKPLDYDVDGLHQEWLDKQED